MTTGKPGKGGTITICGDVDLTGATLDVSGGECGKIHNADGGAMPPITHFAIKPCCLICADVQFDGGFWCDNGMRGDELSICSDFKLRDFGYPVLTVEM